MIRFENECVGCPTNMGCIGSGCPYSHVLHLVCDECGEDVEELYDTPSGQMCGTCVKANFDEYAEYDGTDFEEFDKITEDNATDYCEPDGDDDYYDYADLAYEMKRDERWE